MQARWSSWLLQVVDGGLGGVLFIAPYFFGGRHDFGRLVFVTLVAVLAIAWSLRQTLTPSASHPKTLARWVIFLALTLVTSQIVPLPEGWLLTFSPETATLLPMWTAGGDVAAKLGTWRTISVAPHETAKSLAMLISYALLFLVVSERIADHRDVRRLLKMIAGSGALMAVIGVAQYLTSDGRFFWFYDHPHRSASASFTGPFINRNHFANFLVMSLGPLLCLLLLALRERETVPRLRKSPNSQTFLVPFLMAIATMVLLCILFTRSRGGAAALVASGGVIGLLLATRGLMVAKFWYGLVAAVGLVSGTLALSGSESVVNRLEAATDGSFENLDSGGVRQKLWSANLAAFKSAWLTGLGAGSHRDFCPAYLPQYFTKEYTHAENGYLQIASEAGIGGIVLLLIALSLVLGWTVRAWRNAPTVEGAVLVAATSGGLAASAVHSVVDFVWYIPACMSVVVLLAACTLRLAQLSEADERRRATSVGSRGRGVELAAVALLASGWSVATLCGPGMAALHWDRYLRTSVASRDSLTVPVRTDGKEPPGGDAAEIIDAMLRELEQVVEHDPQFARAHLKLAVRYIEKFDLQQQAAENAITLSSLCDALRHAKFDSAEARTQWLERAIGANLRWLRQAAHAARRAVDLSPLQGEAYVYLARLTFLDGYPEQCAGQLTEQALAVRPRSAEVLFEVGREELARGHFDRAFEHWRNCFADPGPHRQQIIEILAGQIPAGTLLATFEPEWPLLRNVWQRYRASGREEDLNVILHYSLEKTRSRDATDGGVPCAFAWYWQAQLFIDVGQFDVALGCLEQAYHHNSRDYSIRHALAASLQRCGRLSEAEAHYRWCLSRRPTDKRLSASLMAIAKLRQAQRSKIALAGPVRSIKGDLSAVTTSQPSSITSSTARP